MPEYTFKRGKIRSAETWQVDETSLDGPAGESMNWAEIIEAKFADMPTGRVSVSELHLVSKFGSVKLQCNDHPGGESRQIFLNMCHEITKRLEAVQPDLKFVPTAGFRFLEWAMALIGLSAILFGLYYVGVGLTDWGKDGSGFAIGMGVFAMLFGVFLCWCGSPWHKHEPKTAQDTRQWIERILSTIG